MLSSEKPAALRNEVERDTEVERAAAALTPEAATALLVRVQEAAKRISAEGRPFEDPLSVLEASSPETR